MLEYSNFIAVLSAVPQGSVLGPILFLIFVNDICDAIRDCSFKLFADDVQLYLDISYNNSSLILQEAITSLLYWADEWQLEIYYDKCSPFRSAAPTSGLSPWKFCSKYYLVCQRYGFSR